MSIFNQIPKDQIATEFELTGWVGLCPVWLSFAGECLGAPKLAERNWVPEWWLTANLALQELAAQTIAAMGGEPAPGWAIRITGQLTSNPTVP